MVENYVQAGGVLICGDAEAFGSDLAGNDTSATRERILGIKTIGGKSGGVNSEGAKTGSATEGPDRIVLKGAMGAKGWHQLTPVPLKFGGDASAAPGRSPWPTRRPPSSAPILMVRRRWCLASLARAASLPSPPTPSRHR